jgi:hypothetical protein
MSEQLEALRLAELCEGSANAGSSEPWTRRQAAAELRRLHAENEMFRVMHQSHADKLKAVGAINAQLLEALEATTAMLDRSDCLTGYCCCGSPIDGHGFGDGHTPTDEGAYHQTAALGQARAAIAAAKGEA